MAITNATLAAKINALVQQWEDFQTEQQAWMTGAVGGGPNLDGQFPLTDYQGNTVLATSPLQLQDDVDDTVTGSQASADAAAALVSENAAAASESAADASDISATSAKVVAIAQAAAAVISAAAAAADAVLTAADVVSTNADAVSTAQDASDASDSADAAAASAASIDYTWASITGKPTTIAGYGITDGLTSVAIGDIDAGTDGELITWDAAGAAAVVAVGTSGYVLTSGGVGVAPTFQAAAEGGNGETTVFKAADESVTSSSTMQDDDHLFFTGLLADTWYKVEGYWEVSSTIAGDFKTQWVFTETPDDTGSSEMLGNSPTGQAYLPESSSLFNAQSSFVWGGSIAYNIAVSGMFKTNATTGGDLKLTWAAANVTGAACTIRAGSWITITPMT
jgi:hypothetical protein